MEAKIEEWDTQMQKAIYGEITKNGTQEKFNSWEDLNLVDPQIEKGGTRSPDYDNIGMSHRALSAGFYGLKQLREKIESKNKKDAFAEVCIELMAQGGDADTNGTIVGSLCGSYVGFDGIEDSLIKCLGAGDEGKKVGKVSDGRGGFREIEEKKLLEEIVQSSHQKIDSISPIHNLDKSSLKSDREWEADSRFIIGGIFVGGVIGVCASALTVGIVFSAPAVATVTAGLALGGLAGYAAGTIIKNASAQSVASTASINKI
jgi:ADP-ribosylglycohydrolase